MFLNFEGAAVVAEAETGWRRRWRASAVEVGSEDELSAVDLPEGTEKVGPTEWFPAAERHKERWVAGRHLSVPEAEIDSTEVAPPPPSWWRRRRR